MPDLSGQSIDRYHILEPLGQGGMATVYKAFDTRLDCEVAIKFIRLERLTPENSARTLKRFEREAKETAKLRHPNIVSVSDYGEFEGIPYLVMPYIPSGTLKKMIASGRLNWQEAVRMILPIAKALAYAHSQPNPILHRDVKPSNILITESGEPMLADFGIAKILADEKGSTLTAEGVGIGTPEYMAPEQWIGQVTPQADIYALGVVFYEAITGSVPYSADTPAAVLLKATMDPLPRPKDKVPGLPDEVERVLFKALAKKPQERYESMAVFAAALEKLSMLTGRAKPATGNFFREPQPTPAAKSAPTTPPPAPSPPAAPSRVTLKQQMEGEPTWDELTESKPESRLKRHLPWMKLGLAAAAVGGLGLLVGLLIWWDIISAFRNYQWKANLQEFQTEVAAIQTSNTPPDCTQIGQTWVSPIDGMTLVCVPAGEFTMGINSANVPVHTVYLNAFWMDKTEITNVQYESCVNAGSCSLPEMDRSDSHDHYFDNSQFAEFPVIYVGWEQAIQYCTWADRSLPTEAQWEKAARGTDQRVFPWGDDWECSKANADGSSCDGYADTAPVGSFTGGASPYGALDMAGNVWEWVADWYQGNYYNTYSEDGWPENPAGPGPEETGAKVLRGGSWDYGGGPSSFERNGHYPDFGYNNVGFRCALSQP